MIYYRVHKDCTIPYDYSSYDIGIYKDYDLMVSDLKKMLDELADSYDELINDLPDGIDLDTLMEAKTNGDYYNHDAEGEDDYYIGPYANELKRLDSNDWYRLDNQEEIRVSREEFVEYRIYGPYPSSRCHYDGWRKGDLNDILGYLKTRESVRQYAIERKKQRKSLTNSDGD